MRNEPKKENKGALATGILSATGVFYAASAPRGAFCSETWRTLAHRVAEAAVGAGAGAEEAEAGLVAAVRDNLVASSLDPRWMRDRGPLRRLPLRL